MCLCISNDCYKDIMEVCGDNPFFHTLVCVELIKHMIRKRCSTVNVFVSEYHLCKGNVKPYTSYKIIVRMGKEEWCVWRRYSEFLDLYMQLNESYRFNIPDFPSKRFLSWASQRTCNYRKDYFTIFLQAALSKEDLFVSESMREFLQFPYF